MKLLLHAVLVLSTGSLHAASPDDGIPWTSEPVRIDRSQQHYERLPAIRPKKDDRVFIRVPQRIVILDSATFEFQNRRFRIADVAEPLDRKRVCRALEGGRWACGRMAAIYLGHLVRGKNLLCKQAAIEGETSVVRCASGSRDIAGAIVKAGYGRAGAEPLRDIEEKAREAKSGLWRNPACEDDFSHC